MSDIQVVRRQTVGYDQHGDSSYSEDSYIKLLVSFHNGSLQLLKGAPLSVYLAVALREADDPPGATLNVIAQDTSLSTRQALRAIQFLLKEDNRFVQESGFEPTTGAKIYRVAAFAWFGPKGWPSGQKGGTPFRYDKLSPHYDTRVRGMTMSQHVVVGTSSESEKLNQFEDLEQQQQVRQILQKAGLVGVVVHRLSKAVSAETAQAWSDWIQGDDHPRVQNPAGIAVRAILDDPTAQPPAPRVKKERKRTPHMQGRFIDKVRAEGKLKPDPQTVK
jgi:hypothetical protein